MKWWQDVMVWVAILVMCGIASALAYMQGVSTVVTSCKDYRAYKPNDKEVVLCMVVPVPQQQGVGEKQYLRPDGAKTDQLFKRS